LKGGINDASKEKSEEGSRQEKGSQEVEETLELNARSNAPNCFGVQTPNFNPGGGFILLPIFLFTANSVADRSRQRQNLQSGVTVCDYSQT
jgi:hypothetical protein